MALPRGFVALFVVALLSLHSRPARAFDEELQLGLDLAYAVEMGIEGERNHGGGLRGRFRYGLTDAFAVACSIGWGAHAVLVSEGAHVPRNVFTVEIGVIYALDIMRIVPYAGVLVGVAFTSGDGQEAAFSVDLAGGLDLFATQSFSVGLEVAYQLLVASEPAPSRLLVSLRLNWHYRPDDRPEPIEGE